MVKIAKVDRHSRAERAKIRPGDILNTINGNEITDVLDYRFYLAEEEITLSLTRDGKDISVTISKDTYDDIGLEFETPLMDEKQSCRNKCIFCFIDQLPQGLRDTLYFKDDDSRLSFLHGNYITLTNMSEKDIERMIKMHISPVNVSVHTTNPELRVEMMKNKNAGAVLRYLRTLADANLTLRAQVVLCRGVNDGDELDRTMRDLVSYYPALDSVSIVPAGLTKFREGLYPLSPYTPEECGEIIDKVDAFGTECLEKYGSRLFFAADELYIKAGREMPDEDYYEGYPQLENGVGLITSLESEFGTALPDFIKKNAKRRRHRHVSIATGVAAYPLISRMADRIETVFQNLKVDVYEIKNDFFGPEITVAGLLTGHDIANQLAGRDLGDALILSSSTLRSEGDLFLCGMSVAELEKQLGVKVITSDNDGYSFLSAVLGV